MSRLSQGRRDTWHRSMILEGNIVLQLKGGMADLQNGQDN